MKTVFLICRMSFLESIRNRWVINFSFAFAILSFLFSYIGSGEMESFSNFDRLSASLLNIVMVFVPLLGLVLGAESISGDREDDSLLFLLSNPISKSEYFFGKYLGRVLSITTSLTMGLAFSALGMGLGGSEKVSYFLILWILTIFFIAVCVAMGMILTVFATNKSRATGNAIFCWLFLVVLSDLGLMSIAQILRLNSKAVIGLTLLNPVSVFKIFSINILSSDLEILGMGGIYLQTLFGELLPYFLFSYLLGLLAIFLFFARNLFTVSR